MSMDPFNKLVKLTARAFYDENIKGENQAKTGRGDNRGIAVVVLDALSRRQWVKEEELAKDLKLHSKQLRRILRFFEEEKLVTRDHRKESAKSAKIHNVSVAATGDGVHVKEGEEKIKMHTHSYCCLDYAQIYDVVRYRLHRMRKKLKDELEDKNTVQEYVCPNCGKRFQLFLLFPLCCCVFLVLILQICMQAQIFRYNALDALQLVSMEDDFFHCESCNGELVAESDKIASEEVGDGDENARRRRREKLRDMLQKMEVQLRPLMEQINRIRDLPIPEFGTLQAWEARTRAAARAQNGESSGMDPSKSSHGLGYGGTPMPFLGDTKVEVDFSGVDGKEKDIKSEADGKATKVLPPWMIKQGMNLTKEQRGEVKQETKMDGSASLSAPEFSEDKKFNAEDKEKNLKEEYYKAYYAALMKRQQEEAAKNEGETHISDGPSEISSNRQVGMKSKRDKDKGEDDIEWDDASVTENYKVNDLNVEADATADEEDDIDWEEG